MGHIRPSTSLVLVHSPTQLKVRYLKTSRVPSFPGTWSCPPEGPGPTPTLAPHPPIAGTTPGPLSEPSKRGLVGGGPWVPAPRGCHQEAARPLTGEHAPTPPATGPSCRNGDSTRLQVHEQLSASANPLPKCDVGSAHGEQTQQKLRCRDGNTAPVSFQSSLPSPNLIVTPLLQLRSTAPFPPHLESGWPTSGS